MCLPPALPNFPPCLTPSALSLTDNPSCCVQYAEPNVIGLYQKLGFCMDPEGIKGMVREGRAPDLDPNLPRGA